LSDTRKIEATAHAEMTANTEAQTLLNPLLWTLFSNKTALALLK
jgi:hypothetical protein